MCRVLVIDDNEINRQLVELLLTYAGYSVYTAGDADEAFAQLETSPPSLILMDMQLPGMSGLELTRALKAKPDTSDIPVVALTSCAQADTEQKALAAGCHAYIPKPIDTRTFADTIALCLNDAASDS
jgi:two-component system, cell cycle response regulator DivK